MRNSIRETWPVALLFASPILGLELLGWAAIGEPQGFLMGGRGTMPVVAVLVTSMTWWVLVILPKSTSIIRGALAGASSAALTLAVPTIYVAIVMSQRQPNPEGGLADAAGLMALAIYWAIGVPLGSLLGAIAAMLRRRQRTEHRSTP